MNDYFAYIRVSTVKQGQTGVSLQEQRSAITQYAHRAGLSISEWFEDQETAAKAGRTNFSAMMKRLQAGDAAGVLMHKIDRSARNLGDWVRLGELIDHGVKVVFVTESLDLTSRGGRLAADIQAVVAADYIRNLKDEARKGFYGRLKQGLYPLPAPLGYLDRGTGKAKEIDPVRGPLITQAFDLYASGEYSLDRLRAELTARGLTNRNGNPITKGAMSRLLNNVFYTGIICVRRTGETYLGVHEPLTSTATFLAVQNVLTGKTNTKSHSLDFTYKRLITCAACARTFSGERQGDAIYYRCHNKSCLGASCREDLIDDQLSSVFSRISLTPIEVEILIEEMTKVAKSRSVDSAAQLKPLVLQEKQIAYRLDRLTSLLMDELVDEADYKAKRKELLFQQAELEQKRLAMTAGSRAYEARIAQMFEIAKTAQHCHEFANYAEKRELVKDACSKIFLNRKKLSVELFPAYEALANRERVPSSGAQRDIFRKLARSLLGL